MERLGRPATQMAFCVDVSKTPLLRRWSVAPTYNRYLAWVPRMRFLLFMDGLRTNAGFIAVAFLFCLGSLMIWAPRSTKGWRRTTIRTLGSVLIGLSAIVVFLIGIFVSGDPPRQHLGFTSATGSKVALLSHSSLRDSSATRVTVKGNSCCKSYIAYDYYGDGDDYMGTTSVRWLDDHHLVIRHALDPSGVQECHSQVGDVLILCEPQPEPFPLVKPTER